MQHRELPEGWEKDIPTFPADPKGMAGRDSSGKVLNAIAKNVPWLIGGSADLAPSTKTRLTFEGAGDFDGRNYAGRNLHFGIREHAMGAILNGMALSKIRPLRLGFLSSAITCAAPSASARSWRSRSSTFSPTTRSASEKTDPTHQPIEHLALAARHARPDLSVRATPMKSSRPGASSCSSSMSRLC